MQSWASAKTTQSSPQLVSLFKGRYTYGLATASYRLLPTIDIISPILNDDADKFVLCFPKGVARVVSDQRGNRRAEVVNPRLDTVSREVLRHPEFEKKVKLGRVRDHFICNGPPVPFLTRKFLSKVQVSYRLRTCS
jgi:DNA-directed RNA polymerase alpha subunit